MPATTKERVSILEETLNRFIIHTDQALYRLGQEMKDFKDEVRADITDSKLMRKEMNKKWGELANKLGTFAEDVAAPNIPRIARTHFEETEHHLFTTNLRKNHPENNELIYEFDAVLETKNKVFLLETKYTLRDKYIEKLPKIIQNFRDCFPNYADRELVTIFASMSLHQSTTNRLSKMGIYAMAMGDETMDLLNFEAIQQKKKGR